MNSTAAVSGTSLAGHLRLRCERRADGVSYISEQDFRSPIHIGKGHTDAGSLVLNIVNPTAGFFDGDRVDSRVEIGEGASLVLSTPAASRVYRTRSGRAAANHQEFHVGENAFLEWIPEPFIPHAGAEYVQTTRIALKQSSDLLFFEWIAPGRVAKGEVFAYRKLRWELDLELDGKLLARERYDLNPENHSLEALRGHFPEAHYVSVYAAGRMTDHWPAEALDALNGDTLRLGHGPLAGGVHVVRALCRDSLSARRLMGELRCLFYTSAGKTPPHLGRM